MEVFFAETGNIKPPGYEVAVDIWNLSYVRQSEMQQICVMIESEERQMGFWTVL